MGFNSTRTSYNLPFKAPARHHHMGKYMAGETDSERYARYAREQKLAADKSRRQAFRATSIKKARGLLAVAHTYEDAAIEYIQQSRDASQSPEPVGGG